MRQELMSWLRVITVALGTVAVIGTITVIGGSALELVALR
jgi:hypothetical protein